MGVEERMKIRRRGRAVEEEEGYRAEEKHAEGRGRREMEMRDEKEGYWRRDKYEAGGRETSEGKGVRREYIKRKCEEGEERKEGEPEDDKQQDKRLNMMWRDAGRWDLLNIHMGLNDNRTGRGVATATGREERTEEEMKRRERGEGLGEGEDTECGRAERR